MPRSRSFRRFETRIHMMRRLKEDRNQHYAQLDCPCWTDPKAMARFKEQPQVCSNPVCCGNPRRLKGVRAAQLTRQELRAERP